jgi:hypothetical protein
MEDFEDDWADEKRTIGLGTIVLRAVIMLNFIRFALSFLPWFEGTASAAGFADQLFNPRHTDGLRSDFLWLLFSTIYIFYAMFVFVPDFRKEAKARTNVYLGFAWLVAFLIYIHRGVVTGVLDFG